MHFERPPVPTSTGLRTRLHARLRLVGQLMAQAGAPAVSPVFDDADAVHAIRVRHGIACVRAARMWADRGRPASHTLVDAIRRLEDIGRQLAEEHVGGRIAVLELIESSLTIAERQLDGLGGAS